MSFVPLFKIGYLISLIYQIRLYLISYILPVLKVVFDNVAVGPTAHVLWVGPTCLFLLYIFPPSLLPPPMPVGVLRPPALTRASCYYGHLRVTRPRCCRCGCGHLRTTCPWRCPPPPSHVVLARRAPARRLVLDRLRATHPCNLAAKKGEREKKVCGSHYHIIQNHFKTREGQKINGLDKRGMSNI